MINYETKPEEYTALYNDDKAAEACVDYLVASVLVDRDIAAKMAEQYPNSARQSPDAEQMLAALLAAEVVFLNTYHWMEEWPEDARKMGICIAVNCNDMFAWGCADAQEATLSEVPDIFEHWLKDPKWGTIIWCMKKRNMMPQPPVERMIRVAGFWDLDSMGLEESPFKEDWSEENLKRYGTLDEVKT